MENRHQIYIKNNPWIRHLTKARSRCNNPNSSSYKNYGFYGIKCLLNVEDIKNIWFRDKAFNLKRPSIDRIDTYKNYTVDNCRFIELYINIGRIHLEITHCPSKHEYSTENTYINPTTGYRVCKKCNAIRSINNYYKNKEALWKIK